MTDKPTVNFYKINDIDFNNLKFSRTKQNSGKKFINTFLDKNSWGLKLPKLNVNFDTVVDKYGGLSLTLSLGDNKEVNDRLNELDTCIQGYAEEHGWVTDEYKYLPIVKGQAGGRYPQYIKFKFHIDRDTNNYSTRFFKKEGTVKNLVDVQVTQDISALLPRGTTVLTSIEAGGIWVMNNQWGLSFKICHVLVVPTSVPTQNECPQEDNEIVKSIDTGYGVFADSSDSSISDSLEDQMDDTNI